MTKISKGIYSLFKEHVINQTKKCFQLSEYEIGIYEAIGEQGRIFLFDVEDWSNQTEHLNFSDFRMHKHIQGDRSYF